MNYEFKYFDEPLKNARLTNKSCDLCGNDKFCINGIYLDYNEKEIESLCLDCLINSKLPISVPDYLKDKLYNSLVDLHPNTSKDVINKVCEASAIELSKTPPIPWVQYNDWHICCGDFSTYIGEWHREDFIEKSPDGNGKEYLISLLDNETKELIDDVDCLWDEIGEYTIAFVFRCNKCDKYAIKLQDY